MYTMNQELNGLIKRADYNGFVALNKSYLHTMADIIGMRHLWNDDDCLVDTNFSTHPYWVLEDYQAIGITGADDPALERRVLTEMIVAETAQ